jgi:hypothetical protein
MFLRLCSPRVRWLLDRPVKPGDDSVKLVEAKAIDIVDGVGASDLL